MYDPWVKVVGIAAREEKKGDAEEAICIQKRGDNEKECKKEK
jgi:hypothetical protein